MKLLGTAFKIVDGKLTTESKGLSQLTMDSFIVRYTDNVKVGEVCSYFACARLSLLGEANVIHVECR